MHNFWQTSYCIYVRMVSPLTH
ncbi:hypothetical protein ACHAW6_015026 [Cyclotella cf. meneghiniana]